MANNLSKIRGKHQLSQTELAKRIGITKQGLHFNENKRCSYTVARKVAELLNENLFDVLGSDVLIALPRSEEEKQTVINMIKEL